MPCRQAQVLNIYDLTKFVGRDSSRIHLNRERRSLGMAGKDRGISIHECFHLWQWCRSYEGHRCLQPGKSNHCGNCAVHRGTIARNGKLFTLGTSGNNALASAYSLANPIAPVVEAATTVPPPPPTQTLNLWLMASPQTGWVGNYLIGMTYDETGNYGNSRIGAVYFPVN